LAPEQGRGRKRKFKNGCKDLRSPSLSKTESSTMRKFPPPFPAQAGVSFWEVLVSAGGRMTERQQ